MASLLFNIMTKFWTEVFRQHEKELDLRDNRDPQQLGEALQVLRERNPDAEITTLADELNLLDDKDLQSIIDSRLPLNGNVGH